MTEKTKQKAPSMLKRATRAAFETAAAELTISRAIAPAIDYRHRIGREEYKLYCQLAGAAIRAASEGNPRFVSHVLAMLDHYAAAQKFPNKPEQ